jgi:putative spermidine/putrescine transport system permease protein
MTDARVAAGSGSVSRDGRGFLHTAAIAGIVVLVLLPLVPLGLWSVSHSWFFPRVLPAELSLRGWAYLGSPASRVAVALANSLIIGVAVTTLNVVLGVPAGRALARSRLGAREGLELLVLAPLIVPGIAVIMGVQVVFIRAGLADTRPGVVLAHLLPTLPYMVLVMKGVFANYDADYDQQARTLGARGLQVLFHVTLPSVLPGVVIGGLFVFLVSWSQYVLTLMVGGGRVVTLPILLFSFATSGNHAVTAALSIVFVLPAVGVLVGTARYLTGRSAALTGLGNV